MLHSAFDHELTREELIAWYRRMRARTRSLFDIVRPEAYYDRPIALRNPVVFYEGHLPAFGVNTLVKLTHGRPGIDEGLEVLFARGIDPEDETAVKSPTDVWPSRKEVQEYGRAAEALVEANFDAPDEAAFTVLEHELMHQETLLYMLHELPYAKKVRPRADEAVRQTLRLPAARNLEATVRIPAGPVTLGAQPGTFGWDNEFPAMTVDVGEFVLDVYNVTNGAWLQYMEATGAAASHFWERIGSGGRGQGAGRGSKWMWRGMFAPTPLPLDGPVYVTHDQAAAYASWKGARLPSEGEYQRAHGGERDGNFDFRHWDPVPAGSFAPNAFGIHDLASNGWEWTSTLFNGFPGFRAMPSYKEYSADFFDDEHYVLKGASPATARELIRPSFRNWFRPAYPYVYATFRCAR